MTQARNILPYAVIQRLDAVCDQFERDWNAGRSPRIEDCIVASVEVEQERAELLRLLLRVELALFSRAGSLPSLDAYITRFPEHTEIVQSVFGELAHGTVSYTAAASGDTSVSHNGAGLPAVESASHQPGSQADPPQAPDKIGRFAVLGLLGQGAYGRVYRAHDPQLDREVAIKMPRRGVVERQEDVDRFLREARAAATLEHPNICPVHEVGQDAGGYFLVMAYVSGTTLAAHLKGLATPLPARQAALVIRKLAAALSVAHAKGIVHRDLKPANIMLDRERQDVVIMDFGLARRRRPGDAYETQEGVVMGTPVYMAPEQARGDVKAVGVASDIYSLGVMLYEMLVSRPPFTGSLVDVIGQVLHVEPQPPSQVRAGVDRALEVICLKAMAKRIEDRHHSMAELAGALAEWLRTAPPDGSDAGGVGSAVVHESWQDPADALLDQPPSARSVVATEGAASRVAPSPARQAGRTVDFTRPDRMCSTGESAPGSRGSPWRIGPRCWIATAAAFLVASFGAAEVYHIQTDKGTLVVEINDPAIEAKLKHDGLVVHDAKSGRSFTIKADRIEPTPRKLTRRERSGGYKLSDGHGLRLAVLDDDGLEIATNEFKLTRGGKVRVRVAMELPGKPPPIAAATGAATAPDPDRRAAEALVKFGEVKVNGQPGINQASSLPAGELRLDGVAVIGQQDVLADADLEVLRDVHEVRWLNLGDCRRLTDAGVVHLRGLKELQVLALGNTQLTDKGLEHIQGLTNLQELSVGGTQVGDAGLKHLPRWLPKLSHLDIGRTRVTDAGLAHLRGLKEIRSVKLYDNKVTDLGLAMLKELPHLAELDLTQTYVTNAGLEHLAVLTKLRALNLRGTRVSDTGLTALKPHTGLTELILGNTGITDVGLESLKGLQELRLLQILETKVTRAGVQNLHAALPRCTILSDHGTFEPTPVADPDRSGLGVSQGIDGVARAQFERNARDRCRPRTTHRADEA